VVCAIDMPGCGHSTARDCANHGQTLKTRSEHNAEKDGACDLVAAVIKSYSNGERKTQRAVVVGYDWGAGVALSLALRKKYRRIVSDIVCFHPSYNEAVPGELAQIGPMKRKGTQGNEGKGEVSCLVVWCKNDMFHNWKTWKPLAKAIRLSYPAAAKPSQTATKNNKKHPGLQRPIYDEYIFSERLYGTYRWSRHSAEIERKIVEFLSGVDPAPYEAVAHRRAEVGNLMGLTRWI
jgi:hypothetical protein